MAGLDMKPIRYAHCEGHLDLTFDEAGKYLLTCGPDGDVRIYDGFDDDDPVTQQVGEAAYAVACKNDRFYAGTDDNSIQAYVFDSKEPDGLVTRFMAPVTHMCFSKDGKKLVAGSSDFTVKVVDVETNKQQTMQGHDAPILSVALHPEETLVASSSCDGTVRVWRIEDQKCINTITGLAKNNDFVTAPSLVRLTWDNKGKYLVVPFEMEVRVYDTSSWQISFILKDQSITENVSIVRFSPCWRFLAVAYRNGFFVIWDLQEREIVNKIKHEKSFGITALCWNPSKNKQLAYCDNNGYLGMIDNVIPDSVSSTKVKKATPVTLADPTADLFDEDDDDLLLEATNPNSAPRDLTADVPDLVNDDDDDDDEVDIGALKKKFLHITEDSNDQSVTSEMEKKDPDTDSIVSDIRPSKIPSGFVPYETTPLQPPFLSSSTPVHLTHRFMVWNAVGIIVQYNTEEENSINIEFHDTAVHHSLHVTNSFSHTMAALSLEAVLLACESEDERPSKLVCMHFASWDNTKEWTVDMPEGEEIKLICLGEGWAAVATDKRMVRLFTIGGVQREIVSIPGPIVTIVGHGSQLMVIYHKGSGIPGDQCLGIRLLTLTPRKWASLLNGDAVPLNPKSTLAWAGFSAEGTPFTMDSAGVVRMLSRNNANSWVQMANLKKLCKGKSDNYWICSIHENPQQIHALLCKGSRFPVTLPRPTIQILQYQMPMCDLSTDKGTMEEGFLKTWLLSQHLDWWDSQGFLVDESTKSQALIPQQESLMKMFALACKSEREVRAVELCQLMPNYRTVQLAIKYASRLRMMQLAEKLTEVAREKAEEEAMEAQKAMMREQTGFEEEDAYPSNVVNSEASRGHNMAARSRPNRAAEEDEVVTVEEVEEEEESMEQEDDAGNEEQENRAEYELKLDSKPKESTPKTICSQGAKKNPFKVSSQQYNTPPSTGKGTSVFDSMGKPKTGKNKLTQKPVEVKPRTFSFPKAKKNSSSDKGKGLKGFDMDAKKRKRTEEDAQEDSKDREDGGSPENRGSKMSKIEKKDSKHTKGLSQDTSSKLKGFSFGN